MAATTLGTLLEAFLRKQDLDDCTITFEPHHAKVARRSKRSNATLADAVNPGAVPRVSDTKTVGDLLEKLLSLSNEMRAWTTEGNRRYMPRLWDHTGVRVKDSTPLGELRQRATEQQQEGLRRARRILTKALQDCDRLTESSEVDKLLKAMLAERRESAA
jgi:hypothetical protein